MASGCGRRARACTLLWIGTGLIGCDALQPPSFSARLRNVAVRSRAHLFPSDSADVSPDATVGRRAALDNVLRSVFSTTAIFSAGPLSPARAAVDVESLVETKPVEPVEMKAFLDPMGFFSIRVPKIFYILRRSAKGDLPDASGKGRRGASIFTAGNLAKSEVVAVERFPVRVLLEDEGIRADGDLSTFPAIAQPLTVATLLTQRRERERGGGGAGSSTRTKLIQDSVKISEDGRTLKFDLRTAVEVQKPELQLEMTGRSELVRITLARAELRSGDGNLMVVYASGVEQDMEGPDGPALRDTIESFAVYDTSSVAIKQ